MDPNSAQWKKGQAARDQLERDEAERLEETRKARQMQADLEKFAYVGIDMPSVEHSKAKNAARHQAHHMIMTAFKTWDSDNSGSISRDEMSEVMKQLDPTYTDAQLRVLFSSADTNGDGALDYEEFTNWLFGMNERVDRYESRSEWEDDTKREQHGLTTSERQSWRTGPEFRKHADGTFDGWRERFEGVEIVQKTIALEEEAGPCDQGCGRLTADPGRADVTNIINHRVTSCCRACRDSHGATHGRLCHDAHEGFVNLSGCCRAKRNCSYEEWASLPDNEADAAKRKAAGAKRKADEEAKEKAKEDAHDYDKLKAECIRLLALVKKMEAGSPENNAFCAQSYLDRYGDLQKAFGTDLKAAKKHFIDHGKKEGRDGTCSGENAGAEAATGKVPTNFDEMKALNKTDYGYIKRECARLQTTTCCFQCYLDRYADLQKAFGSDLKAAEKHWKDQGKKEGRDVWCCGRCAAPKAVCTPAGWCC